MDGKLLRGDIKGRGILAEDRPGWSGIEGDRISRMGRFVLQLDWTG